jgi:GH25 family lysozyme M1 (1,4-beta-N-acetylmuramidase)
MDITQMEWGPDVNHWHPVRDWSSLGPSDATFFGAKATEGAHTVDDQFEQHRDGFRAHCDSFTAAVWYHFFHAEKDSVTQAEHFADVVGPLEPRERLCCDFEGMSYKNVDLGLMRHGLQYLEAFYARLDSLGVLAGTRPLIYTSAQHWQAIGNPAWARAASIDLWTARYFPGTPKAPDVLPSPWPSWSVLQYSDGNNGVVREVPGVGLCDVNVLAPTP